MKTRTKNQKAKAMASLSKMKTMDEWLATASPSQIQAATNLAGSPQKWYRKSVDSMISSAECDNDTAEQIRKLLGVDSDA